MPALRGNISSCEGYRTHHTLAFGWNAREAQAGEERPRESDAVCSHI